MQGRVWKIVSFLVLSLFLTFSLTYSSSALSKSLREFYAQNNIFSIDPCSGTTSSGGMQTCGTVSGNDITWIGDSYTDAALDIIQEKLPGVDLGSPVSGDENSHFSYERVGKHFDWINTLSNGMGGDSGVKILESLAKEKKLRPYIVFALGTNDESTYSQYISSLEKIASLIGSSKIILVTAATNDGVNYSEGNRAKKEFAESHDNFFLADWSAISKPEYYDVDPEKVHPYNNLNDWVEVITNTLPTTTDCNTGEIWKGQTYALSDGQLRGLSAVAIKENGGTLHAFQFEVSIFANLFEFYKSGTEKTADNLVNYVRTAAWFRDKSRAAYDETSNISDEYFQAIKDILVNGNRTIPPEILEHDSIGDIKYLENNGSRITDSSSFWKMENYIKNQTTILALGDPYYFYEWANPDGDHVSDDSNNSGTGDPFGYIVGTTLSPSTASNPGNSSGGSSLSSSSSASLTSAGEAVNYNGDIIFTKNQIDLITKYQPIYEEAVKGTGLPWQILPVLHNRENSLSLNNPNNGQGLFQFYTRTQNGEIFPSSGTADDAEFLRQAKLAAADFIADIKNSGYDISSDQGIKYGFFRYNGTASTYITQALNLNFSQEEAKVGEGSPYVMNRYDAKRDPTVEPTKSNNTWGQIKRDGGSIEYPANTDFGAYVQYAALKGAQWTSTGGLPDSNGCPTNTSNGITGNGGGSIAETARSLAWPDTDHTQEVKPEFLAAAKALGEGERGYCPGYRSSTGRSWPDGPTSSNLSNLDHAQDCGVFVSTVVRTTGIDPDFPVSGTSNLESHMSSSSLWQEINNDGTINNLQPGDIFVWNSGSGEGANGHTLIYVGNNQIASASLCNRTGDIRDYSWETNLGKYRIFRSTVSSGTSGGTTGSFDEELKAIEKATGSKVGAAVSAPGNTNAVDVQVGGSWYGGRAWSTIKVPLSIAASQKSASTGSVVDPYGGTCSHDLSSAIHKAITESDNCAAWWLWTALGGDNSSAAETVTNVLREGKDSTTSVVSSGDNNSLTSGKTDWSLVNQALFAANLPNVKNSGTIMKEMRTHNAGDGTYGLNTFTAMTKGGWGSTITRQFGIIKLSNGKCSAVAIGTEAGSNFSILNKIAQVLKNHESDLPSGSCPGGL